MVRRNDSRCTRRVIEWRPRRISILSYHHKTLQRSRASSSGHKFLSDDVDDDGDDEGTSEWE